MRDGRHEKNKTDEVEKYLKSLVIENLKVAVPDRDK